MFNAVNLAAIIVSLPLQALHMIANITMFAFRYEKTEITHAVYHQSKYVRINTRILQAFDEEQK